jgi:hypothetical protein
LSAFRLDEVFGGTEMVPLPGGIVKKASGHFSTDMPNLRSLSNSSSLRVRPPPDNAILLHSLLDELGQRLASLHQLTLSPF